MLQNPALRKVLAAVFLVLGLADLLVSASVAARVSSQMDFAVYWVASRTVSAGLDPYRNHADTDLRFWDGNTRTRDSRFLYPPILADFFRPLGSLDYGTAKAIWTGLQVAAIIGLAWGAARAFKLRGPAAWIAIGLAVRLAPVDPALDRGQIDPLVALGIGITIWSLTRNSSRWMAGAGSAAAAVVKPPHAVLILGLVAGADSRRRRALLIGALGVSLIAVLPRPVESWHYLTSVLPRIAQHGQLGDGATFLPRDFQLGLRKLAPLGYSWLDGQVYPASTLAFEPSATVVGPLRRLPGLRQVSAPVLTALIFLTLLLFRLRSLQAALAAPAPLPRAVAGAWLAASVLLVAPLTWTMNLVWLLPLVPAAVAARRIGEPRYLLEIGLLIVGLPFLLTLWSHPAPIWWPGRFTIGLFLIVLALDRELRRCLPPSPCAPA